MSNDEIQSIFRQLGFETTLKGETLTVNVPSRRKDITIKEDLIEEVARIYGYDEILHHYPYLAK